MSDNLCMVVGFGADERQSFEHVTQMKKDEISLSDDERRTKLAHGDSQKEKR